jgi:hypothetical protein
MLCSGLLRRIRGRRYRDDLQVLRTWISWLKENVESDPSNLKLICIIPRANYVMDLQSA